MGVSCIYGPQMYLFLRLLHCWVACTGTIACRVRVCIYYRDRHVTWVVIGDGFHLYRMQLSDVFTTLNMVPMTVPNAISGMVLDCSTSMVVYGWAVLCRTRWVL